MTLKCAFTATVGTALLLGTCMDPTVINSLLNEVKFANNS